MRSIVTSSEVRIVSSEAETAIMMATRVSCGVKSADGMAKGSVLLSASSLNLLTPTAPRNR